MPSDSAEATADVPEREVVERLSWLLRLRWLVLPVFIAVELASELVSHRRWPLATVAAGGALLLANAIYAALVRRTHGVRALLAWARVEAAAVVAVPVVLVVAGGDPANPLRYAVLVGVVGAAVLPWAVDVAMVGAWSFASLVVADVIALGFDPARIDGPVITRWALEGGIILTVATLTVYLQRPRVAPSAAAPDHLDDLARVHAEWEAAIEAVRELVVVTDPEGRVVRANRAFRAAVSVRSQELAGRALADVLREHPEAWWAPPADGAMEIEDPVFDTVLELRALRVGDRIVRVARDLGEARRLEARLVQADKLAGMGVLATSAAHEMGSPITFVTANLTELRRYLAAYEAALSELAEAAATTSLDARTRARLSARDVSVARREAGPAIEESLRGMDRINRIVGDLRSLARRDPVGEPATTVDLKQVVEAVFRTAGGELRNGGSRLEVAGPAYVNGHRGELVDVVLNLVVNAIQAKAEDRANEVVVALKRENGHAVLRVSDTGTGITPAHMKRLFEPFFTTKAPGDGTGLGLSLARRIVIAHGGSIEVASEPGRGSTFTVRLPAVEAPAAATPAPVRAAVA